MSSFPRTSPRSRCTSKTGRDGQRAAPHPPAQHRRVTTAGDKWREPVGSRGVAAVRHAAPTIGRESTQKHSGTSTPPFRAAVSIMLLQPSLDPADAAVILCSFQTPSTPGRTVIDAAPQATSALRSFLFTPARCANAGQQGVGCCRGPVAQAVGLVRGPFETGAMTLASNYPSTCSAKRRRDGGLSGTLGLNNSSHWL